MKPRLAISFSGGRTSAVMTKLLHEQFGSTHDISTTFANTGCEHENTLKFVNDCDKHFGWNVVWLEAVVNPVKGKGVRHRVVTYETASRKGEPMWAYMRKEGLTGKSSPGCNDRLKVQVMYSFLSREHGWKKGTYDTAIGIRSDEADRMSTSMIEKRFVYPLVAAQWTKQDVKAECATWPFDLELKGDHYGNCVWCWKKSLRKLMTVAREDSSYFAIPLEAEKLLSPWPNKDGELEVRELYRERTTAQGLLDMAKSLDFEPYRDIDQTEMFSIATYDVFLDTGSGCGESCEIGADN